MSVDADYLPRSWAAAPVMMITYAANALSISVPLAGAELALVYHRQVSPGAEQ